MAATAIIVAAGQGERLGGVIPKQYLPLRGKPLVAYCLRVFSQHPAIATVILVVQPQHQAYWQPLCGLFPWLRIVEGGATRQASVANALAVVEDEQVIVHDAARPLLTAAMVDACLDALQRHAGAIIAAPIVDTLKRAQDNIIQATVDRQYLVAAQTPQAFHTKVLKEAYATATQPVTDDAALLEAAGVPVAVITGLTPNPKVTYAGDMTLVESLLPPLLPHVGTGFDVHAFTKGDAVMLCGVRVPHTRGLAAHSDGDVALHALTDAILGALGMGDIGEHFPPSDPQWRGKDSVYFVAEAMRRLGERGGVLYNADVTIICERPRLTAYKQAMRARLQEILGIQAVNVKATTTEKLGFTGREEGIAAQAAVLTGVPAAP